MQSRGASPKLAGTVFPGSGSLSLALALGIPPHLDVVAPHLTQFLPLMSVSALFGLLLTPSTSMNSGSSSSTSMGFCSDASGRTLADQRS